MINQSPPKPNTKLYFGDVIKLKHINTKNCLHSHEANYQEGSKNFQVTAYHNRDDNDWFVVEGTNASVSGQVRYNQTVRLRNESHGQYLYSSSKYRSPVSNQQEVCTCIDGLHEYNPGHSTWKFLSGTNCKDMPEHVEVNQPLRLVHNETGSMLHSHPGFNFNIGWGLLRQQEVTCYPPTQDTNNDWILFEIRGKFHHDQQ
ncbi:hypothetical protein AKO1_006713 [Acrasis kona]|uniref:MIR domain-containing protein n=1 Tax=Acrasis kona TaxID=1008807 RepID=A0AAW2ZA00_9EUKA